MRKISPVLGIITDNRRHMIVFFRARFDRITSTRATEPLTFASPVSINHKNLDLLTFVHRLRLPLQSFLDAVPRFLDGRSVPHVSGRTEATRRSRVSRVFTRAFLLFCPRPGVPLAVLCVWELLLGDGSLARSLARTRIASHRRHETLQLFGPAPNPPPSPSPYCRATSTIGCVACIYGVAPRRRG